MTRVLHVIDSLDLGGAQTLLLDLCRHADTARFGVEVACMHGPGVFAAEFENAGIPVHVLSPSTWPPKYIPNFLKLIARRDPEIIHFHLFGSNLIAKPLAALAGKQALIVHDHTNAESRLNSLGLLIADSLANRFSTRVIAVAESVRKLLIEREGLCEDRVITLPNGVDTGIFSPATPEQKIIARRSLGLSHEHFIVGGVGRLAEVKNMRLFLEAAAGFLKHTPCARFVIAGTGPLERELREQAVSLQIDDSVHFLGHVSNRIELYRSLDALMITSDSEGTPMTLLEAIACGVPVVSSAVGGIPEVCENHADALLVPPRDVKGFTEALRRLHQEEGLSQKLARNALFKVIERYEIRKLVARIEGVYADITNSDRSNP